MISSTPSCSRKIINITFESSLMLITTNQSTSVCVNLCNKQKKNKTKNIDWLSFTISTNKKNWNSYKISMVSYLKKTYLTYHRNSLRHQNANSKLYQHTRNRWCKHRKHSTHTRTPYSSASNVWTSRHHAIIRAVGQFTYRIAAAICRCLSVFGANKLYICETQIQQIFF